ncbi:MAG TPA: chromate resistance protein ChrB domain-containing protein [Desulfobacterales bacterium]|nr:chromate resistance protein ChrB domain-containing protein [Desulfobacterales bacterium]
MDKSADKHEWLLLIHQIPPKPSYFRVKIWRRLQQIGAVAVKQSVYAMPKTPQAHEDLNWTLKEIVEGGGDASLCEARFLEGLTNEQVVSMFQAPRRADYAKIIQEAGALQKEINSEPAYPAEAMARFKSQLFRLQDKLHEVRAIDFFSAPERSVAEMLLENVNSLLKGSLPPESSSKDSLKKLKGRTWVTRDNVFVDRIACAWLIRRFVDPDAEFKFAGSKKYKPQTGEIRYDMFEAEFTHEGDLCSFEVMVERLGLDRRILAPLAEIVHDIDLKDDKFGRPEAAGVRALIAGLAAAHPADIDRIDRGAGMFDDLLEYFKRQVKP